MFSPEKFITTTQAASLAGVGYDTIVKAMKAGELKYKAVGSHKRTTESWLAEWQSHTGEKKAAPKFEYQPKLEKRKPRTPEEIRDYYLNLNKVKAS